MASQDSRTYRLYVTPVVLWLVTYALSFAIPSLNESLSLRFPYIPSSPTFADAVQHSNMSGMAESGGGAGAGGRFSPASFVSPFMNPFNYVRFTGQMIKYYWNLALLEATHMGSDHGMVLPSDGASNSSSSSSGGNFYYYPHHRSMWHHALTAVTSIFVHPNYESLIITIGRFAYCLLPHSYALRGGNPLANLTGGLVGCIMLNCILLLSKRGLAPRGAITSAGSVFSSSQLRHLLKLLYPFVVSIWLRPVAFITGRSALDGNGGADFPFSPTFAYLSGGESLCYAIVGFNYSYYRNITSLGQFITSYVLEEMSNIFYLEVYESLEGTHAAATPTDANATTGGQIFFTTSSSSEMHLTSLLALLCGVGVGAVARRLPVLAPILRRVPVAAWVMEYLFPSPLPAIPIPDGLLEATSAGSGLVVRVHRRRLVDSGGDADDCDCCSSAVCVIPGASDEVLYEVLTTPIKDSVADGKEEPDDRRHCILEDQAPSDEDDNHNKDDDDEVNSDDDGIAEKKKEELDLETQSSSSSFIDIVIPSDCFCPITRCLMSDPVRTDDGFTYDREAITLWLEQHNTSPMTNLSLANTAVESNFTLYNVIADISTRFRAFCV